MAQELDSPTFDFSIESTDIGNAQILKGLYESETSTSPDDVKILEKEKPVIPPKKEEKKAEDKKDEEVKKDEDPINTLLGKDEEAAEDEDPKDENKETEDKEGEINHFQVFSKDLFKLGVFSKDEGEEEVEITSPEEFLDRFNYEKKKGANEIVSNFISQFGEDYQQAFEAIYVKGADPKEYFTTYSNIENLSDLDLTKESNQEAVVKQALKEQGYDDNSIVAKLAKLKDYGDLSDEAQHAHKVLMKREAQKLQELEKNAEQQQLQKAQLKQQYIVNVKNTLESKLKTSEFDGIPINPKLAGEVQDFLITERYKTPSGEILTEFDKTIIDLKRPENHATKVKIALLLKLLEKDPTLSTIQKAGVTKKTDALFQEVARQSSKTSVKTDKPTPKSPSWTKIL